MMSLLNPSVLFRFFNRQYLICCFPAEEKKLFLTFDDGPDPEVTPQILDILKERNAVATFFCKGENVKKYPGLFNRIKEEGHTAGNHTFSHLDGWKTPPGEYFENVTRCDEFFVTDIFRPPFGRFSLSQYYLLRKKYRFILWSVMSGDYHRNVSPEKCLINVTRKATSGSIIVFHDTPAASAKVLFALPRLLDFFLEKGFQFYPVPSLRQFLES